MNAPTFTMTKLPVPPWWILKRRPLARIYGFFAFKFWLWSNRKFLKAMDGLPESAVHGNQGN